MLTKKDLEAIRKIFREEMVYLHTDIRKGLQGIDKKLDQLITKQDLSVQGLRNDIQELTKLLHMYMELTHIYREKQTILEGQVEEILMDLGNSEN